MSATYNNVPKKYLKVKDYHYLHVFTDNQDYHFDIKKLGYGEAKKQAYAKKDELIKTKNENIRIYAILEEEDYRDGKIEALEEICIFSLGNYPN